MKLFSLTSNLHAECIAPAREESFIRNLEAALGCAFEHCDEDFSHFGEADDDLVYVRTGGTEGSFRKVWNPSVKNVRLLTSGQSNSLAASMEIVSFLRQHGAHGSIIHGDAASIAAQLKGESAMEPVKCLKHLGVGRVLEGVKLGVVGRPSDWLISSDVDYAAAKAMLGLELVDVPMEELLAEISRREYDLPDGFSLNALGPQKYGKAITEKDMELSLSIYGALKRIVGKYSLDGLSLRCFDLLTAVGSTGCLALAILNSESITATCEGDVPAMITMEVCKRICGTPGFQVNLSRISNGTALFAHCTVPLNLVKDYCYDTHFESGIGVAVHGEFATGPATIVKIGAGLDEYIAEDVELVANSYGDNLCRTQVLIRGAEGKEIGLSAYFLTSSLGNHHVIVPGKWASELNLKLQ